MPSNSDGAPARRGRRRWPSPAVTLSVVPVGTANLLAGTIGATDRRQAAEIADTGDTRWVDVGFADGEPFLVSCIAGLPAEASLAASGDLSAGGQRPGVRRARRAG